MKLSRQYGCFMAMCLFLLPCLSAAQTAVEAPEPVTEKEDAQSKPDSVQPEDSEESEELKSMKKELEQLKTEYELLVQRQKNSLLVGELAKQKIAAAVSLRKAQQEEDLAEVQAEVARLQAESALREAKQKQELSELQTTIEQRTATRRLEDLKVADLLADMKAEASRLAAENALQQEKIKQSQSETEATRQKYLVKIEQLKGQLGVLDAKEHLHTRVATDIDYLKNPFFDGTLYISDRRISLNGPIVFGVADYVTERIHYFNNQSQELPIFIVIDYCPGGSVMQGYRIVKAIESSTAPVHVIVKSFAASMAAVITTLADKSYAYPNAVILHHQMSYVGWGNMTQQAEQLENAKEWSRRLSEPVAKKLGMTAERFVELMYEHNSSGDWEEFANNARQLKWVGEIVHEIREVGIRQRPKDDVKEKVNAFFDFEEVDSEGKRFIRLPRLQPFDHYFIYNPDGYYR